MPKQRKKKEGVYRRKGSKYWWASYTETSGRRVQRSTGTTTKREALALCNKWKTDVWNQTARQIEPNRTFEQLVVLYLRGTMDVKRSTDTDKQRFKALAEFFPEALLMNTLCSADVLGYIACRQDTGISNKTINKELSLLSSTIKWAKQKLDWDLPNPVVGKRLPEENNEARCLTVDEFSKLLCSAKQARSSHTRRYLPEFCVLGFCTMMRPGEMLELNWERVDFDNEVVRLEVEHTKGKARRLVPLNDEAFAALLRLRRVSDEYFPDTPWVFTHTTPRYFGKRIQDVRKVFQTAVDRAGIAHATPHCLRHTSITESVHAPNANIVDISKVAGHRNLKTTMGYVHTADKRLREVVANLPSVHR